MPNELNTKQTTKQRASRIPLDYHKRPDAIRKSRKPILIVAGGVAVAAVAAIAFSKQWLNAAISPGPVARVHQASELKCADCHDSFVPIHEDARQTGTLLRLPDSTKRIEDKCQKCHPSASHYPNQHAEAGGSCTACHHEHRGEEASLTEADERFCTRCHENIGAEFKDVRKDARSIKGFPAAHPEFELPKVDQTKLKFNHALHLAPGLKIPGDGRQADWTLADVAPSAREKYLRTEPNGTRATLAETDLAAPLQLECSNCHVTLADKSMGQDTAAELLLADFLKNLPRNQSPLQTGAYMLPVTFAEHCQGCHPLTYDLQADDKAHSARLPAYKTEVPHAVESERLRQLLQGRGWEKAALEQEQKQSSNDQSQQPKDQQPARQPAGSRIRPFPGQSAGRLPSNASANVEGHVRVAETHLRDVTCKKCHAAAAPALPDGMVSVEPVNLPTIWLQKSHFNHWAHQSVFRNSNEKCLACHHAAATSTETKDVLIEGIKTCSNCHSPEAKQANVKQTDTPQAAADYRCVECHRYHRGDLTALDQAKGHGRGAKKPSAAPAQEGNRASD